MTAALLSYQHLYVHVPFCRRRCSYCDFSIAVRRNVPSEKFVAVIKNELHLRLSETAPDTPLLTVYLGGGTPSLLTPVALETLLGSIRDAWSGTLPSDVTIEANPDDVSEAAAKTWKNLGVTRVSLGVQSLRPEALAWMHRTHSDADALTALDVLMSVGFDSVSADVIFGLPGFLNADPAEDAVRLVEMGVSHVSAYGLTVESSTPLAKRRDRGGTVQSDEDVYVHQFKEIHHRLVERGFEHYEVSNYGKPGHRSRHNYGYWGGAPFLGIGPAAHSHAHGQRWWNVRPWAEYEKVVAAHGDPTQEREMLDESQRWLEAVYLGLRTDSGLAGINAQRLPAEDLNRLVERGYLEQAPDGVVTATLEGWLCLDEVVARLTTSGQGG